MCRSKHVDGACWRLFGCVLGDLKGANGVTPLLPLNVQNRQREVAIWQPTKRTEKVKASMYLAYIEIVDGRPNLQKVQFSFKAYRVKYIRLQLIVSFGLLWDLLTRRKI